MKSEEAFAALQRLNDANALLARVNRLVFEVDDSTEMLRQVCQLAVDQVHAHLTFLTRPDEEGRFHFFSAAGDLSYLNDLFISTNPDVSAGQGGFGQAWREARAYFINDFTPTSFLADWRARALDLDLHSAAILPVFRQGKLWALFVLLMTERHVFDETLQSLLEILARDVSQGIERIMARRLQHALLDNTVVGMALTAGRKIIFCNKKCSEMFSYTTDELMGAATQQIYADEAEYLRVGAAYQALRNAGSVVELQAVRFVRKDGSLLLCDVSGIAFGDTDDDRVVWTLVNVDLREQQTQYLLAMQQAEAWRARHDSLTELPNRFALEQYLPQAIAHAKRTDTVLAVGFLDLDDFKSVNDSLGHDAGDTLLCQLVVRLRKRLRASDFLARLGGDEFVVVIEDFDTQQFGRQLKVALERLHGAVESPFELASGVESVVGMSMGVVLFPFDSEDPDELLRLADAAMYQSKQNKALRTSWWQQVDVLQQQRAVFAFNPYGQEAIELLTKFRDFLHTVNALFLQGFYADKAQYSKLESVFSRLLPAELEALKTNQMEHLQFIMQPDVQRQDVLDSSTKHLSATYMLMGVDALNLMRMSNLWRRLMINELNRANLAARDRYLLVLIADARLQDDIQAQLEAGQRTMTTWFDVLAQPLPDVAVPWVDVQQTELSLVGDLQGIRVCAVLRPNAEGVFKVEASAGEYAEAFREIVQHPDKQILLDVRESGGKGLVPLAFRDGVMHTTIVHGDDEHVSLWHEDARRFGVFSMVAIPLPMAPEKPRVVLALYGAYPNQFDTVWVAQFCRGLQQRWSGLLMQRELNVHETISQDLALAYRERLFAGGLRMLVQPVVDLHAGKLVKAEVLARLVLDDGSMIAPNVFLPLLGIAELDHLFRLGLDMALEFLKQWEARGLIIDVSINLSPSTLLNIDCPAWVDAALRQHGVAPHRLVLELLETQDMDSALRQETVEQLSRLGVKLAMDDLGSGYSSLLRMAAMPFDIIKVDQGLLRQLRKSPVQTLALVVSILQIGRDFEREVIIEGLEDADMVDAVMLLGARFGQGYALARPMLAAQLPDWQVPSYDIAVQQPAIKSYLGALAWHWAIRHGMTQGKKAILKSCPMTRFLLAQQPVDDEAVRWHAAMHEKHGSFEEAGLNLMNWLVEKVRHQ